MQVEGGNITTTIKPLITTPIIIISIILFAPNQVDVLYIFYLLLNPPMVFFDFGCFILKLFFCGIFWPSRSCYFELKFLYVRVNILPTCLRNFRIFQVLLVFLIILERTYPVLNLCLFHSDLRICYLCYPHKFVNLGLIFGYNVDNTLKSKP